ncbi:MAG TPA: pilus assembly protein PilM [Candidatus Acidoferrum sp.]|nr:pilus assembly protein PilM [Candidatus Acidoferrum sp.]
MTARLALDLGAHELKILEVSGRKLTRHTEILLPDGALVDGMPTPLLTTAFRSALEAGGFTATRARLAIAETGTAFRDFRLPRLPADELRRAVEFEGRRQVPMEAADVHFAWHAIRDKTGYAVYLVAARRDMIDAIVAAVNSAGLEVERIDLKPLALARGMDVSDGLLLEWAAAEATLVLMVKGRPRFFRTFPLDAPSDDPEAQLEELTHALNALVKFMRGTASDVAITPATTLALGGRFAFLPEGIQRAEQRFNFSVTVPTTRFTSAQDFPWQAHFAGLGLLSQARWYDRLTPSQGGDNRVAA